MRIFGIATSVIWCLLAVRQIMLWFWLPRLSDSAASDIDVSSPMPNPLFSLIVPARNEADTLPVALDSLFACLKDDPRFEVIFIDDHSDDSTGQLFDEAISRHPASRVLHLRHPLPSGWWGKNYACWQGYLYSRGRWLLFADADTTYQSAVFQRVAAYLLKHEPDHVVLYPRLRTDGFLEGAFQALFAWLYLFRFDPFLASKSGLDVYTGLGAFATFSRDCYEAIGGHRSVRLELADDIKLGRLVKGVGRRTIALAAADELSIRWRSGVWDTVQGSRRILMAGLDYDWGTWLIGLFAIPFGLLSAYILLCWPATQLMSVVGIIAIGVCYVFQSLTFRTDWKALFWHPISSLIFGIAYVWAALGLIVNQGVRWRGGFIGYDMLLTGRVGRHVPPLPSSTPLYSSWWQRTEELLQAERDDTNAMVIDGLIDSLRHFQGLLPLTSLEHFLLRLDELAEQSATLRQGRLRNIYSTYHEWAYGRGYDTSFIQARRDRWPNPFYHADGHCIAGYRSADRPAECIVSG